MISNIINTEQIPLSMISPLTVQIQPIFKMKLAWLDPSLATARVLYASDPAMAQGEGEENFLFEWVIIKIQFQ
jgi:hypothetical protein